MNIKNYDDAYENNLTIIDEEKYVEEMLNECYGTIEIVGLTYEAGTLLKRVDPIAFNEIVRSELSENESLTELEDGTVVLTEELEDLDNE